MNKLVDISIQFEYNVYLPTGMTCYNHQLHQCIELLCRQLKKNVN